MTTTEGKCPRAIWNGHHSHTCDRPVKRNGLCGIHAAADERVAANAEKYRAAQDARIKQRETLADQMGRLQVLGVQVDLRTDRQGNYHLQVADPDGLIALLEGNQS